MDPQFGPYLGRRFFVVQASPVPCGATFLHLRFVFDAAGPRIEMRQDVASPWVPTQDYENFRLAPEDLPHLAEQDLNDLVELFRRSVQLMYSGSSFLYTPLVVA